MLVAFRAIHKFWSHPTAWRQFDQRRVLLTAAGAALAVWAFLAVEFPCTITAPAQLQPVAADRVYVSTPGRLDARVLPGDSVTRGQILAQLEDPELRRKMKRLDGERQIAETRVRKLEARLADEPEAAAQLAVAEEMLTDVEQQIAQRKRDAEDLILRAPQDGVVIEPPEIPRRPIAQKLLPTWDGTPFDTKNAECYLERGTLLCLVGNPQHQEAVLYVDESNVQYVRVGQQARMTFAVAPTTVLTGRVEEIAKPNALALPNELSDDEQLASRRDAAGEKRPLHTVYSVRVALEPHREHLLTGATGRAKIAVDPQTCALRLLRLLRATFTVRP